MIFRKSLSKKKGVAYSFFSGISEGFVPAVVITLIQTFLMAVMPLIVFINTDFEASDGAKLLSKDKYKFYIFEMSGSSEFFVLFGILGILSILVAVMLFRFICDKRTVNVFYSLGIKRSSLFMAKYCAGAVLLIGATMIPVILSYTVNLIFLGGSWQLSLVMLHMYCGLSVFSLICFSVASVVFSSVGTVSESVVYSVALLFAPTVIIWLTERIIGAFLPSSTLGVYVQSFGLSQHGYWEDTSQSLLENTSDYNPLLFFVNEISAFSKGFLEDGKLSLRIDRESAQWYIPKLYIHLPWFIIAVALGGLGSLLFKRLKAENCGFLNTNKILSNLAIFELCLLGSSVLLSEMRWQETWVVITAGVLAALALYIIAEIFLKRNFLKILKASYKFVIHITVVALIYSVCATGLFGYGEYIPDTSKIESVEISVPYSHALIATETMDLGWSSDAFIRIYTPYRYKYLPVMTEKEDIDKIVELNRYLNKSGMDDGTHNTVVIRYKLKNGKVSERRHFITSKEETNELLKLVETKAYKEEITKLFSSTNGIEAIKAENNRYGWVEQSSFFRLAFEYDYSVVTARTNTLQENKVLNLTKEQFASLKDAVYKDVMNLNMQSYFLNNQTQLGVLSFGINEKAHQIEGVNGYSRLNFYTESVTQITNPDYIVENEPVDDTPVDDIPVDDIPVDDIPVDDFYIEEPEDTRYTDINNNFYESLGGMNYEHTYDIVITADMTNTLNTLNSMGYSDCFTSSLEIESISFRQYDTEKIFSYFSRNDNDFIHDFFAYPLYSEFFDAYIENGATEEQVAENKITDKENIKTLDGLMKLHEYTFNDGYFCLVKYKNGTYCVKYLSKADAPDFVNNYNYTMTETFFG